MSQELVAALARLEAKQDAQTEKLERIDRALIGNGRAGLIVEVDRLKQSEERRKWAVRAMAGALCGVAVKAFWGVWK
jgi:hypothetical protein